MNAFSTSDTNHTPEATNHTITAQQPGNKLHGKVPYLGHPNME